MARVRDMPHGKWNELKRRSFTPEQIAEIERRAKEELLKLDLREMRKRIKLHGV